MTLFAADPGGDARLIALQHSAAIAQPQRVPPLELHYRLVRTQAGEGVALQQRLGLLVRLRGGVLPHRVQERRWRDQPAPAAYSGSQ